MIQAIKPNLNFTGRIMNHQKEVLTEEDQKIPLALFVVFARRLGTTSLAGMTHYVYVQDLVFAVTRPEPYSFLEKALLPLDSEVWWWLIGFLAFGVMVNTTLCVRNEGESAAAEHDVSVLLCFRPRN
jgi:hypothetical protein